jgi:hypothetical protein
MPSELYRLIWQAMRERQLILFKYDGLPRTACPVILGYGADGKESVFAFQIAGRTSGKQKLPAWKCFKLAKAQDPGIQGGQWLEGASHQQTQTCIAFVDVDVNIPERLKHKNPLEFGSPKLRPPR